MAQFLIVFDLAESVNDSDQYGMQAAAITVVELERRVTRSVLCVGLGM